MQDGMIGKRMAPSIGVVQAGIRAEKFHKISHLDSDPNSPFSDSAPPEPASPAGDAVLYRIIEEPDALSGRVIPWVRSPLIRLADGVGFEPTRSLHPWRFSRPLPSTTRPPIHPAEIAIYF